MEWTKHHEIDEDYPGPEYESLFWTSGVYKIKYIHEDPENRNQFSYRAYYKPKGWKNWGNYIDASKKIYKSFEEAAEACKTHKSKHEGNE